MKADRFFSIHYDMRHNPKVELLRDMGGGMVALGRWVVLMSLLYDANGIVDVTNKARRRYVARELELDDAGLDGFLRQCAECELISTDLLNAGHVVSEGVCEQLDYTRKKSEAGKKGNAKRWGNRNQNRKADSKTDSSS